VQAVAGRCLLVQRWQAVEAVREVVGEGGSMEGGQVRFTRPCEGSAEVRPCPAPHPSLPPIHCLSRYGEAVCYGMRGQSG